MRTLYRSRKNRIIAGVCGGIGEYLDIDPAIIRIAWLLLTFLGGMSIIVYILAWVVIPDEKSKKNVIEEWSSKEDKEKSNEVALMIGLFLVFIGVTSLMNNFGWWQLSWSYTWPAVIIIIGVILLIRGKRK